MLSKTNDPKTDVNVSGPRNYGKSIEWKLEGDPWVSEGLYSDSTRGIYLLCLILQVREIQSLIWFVVSFVMQAISPLGWRVSASMDVASKNLDNNEESTVRLEHLCRVNM